MDETMNQVLETAVNGLISQGILIGGSLRDTGIEIFGGVVALKLFFMWLDYMFDAISFQDLAGYLVRTTIQIGLISYFLITYSSAAGISGMAVTIPDFLVQRVTGNSGPYTFTQGVTEFNNVLRQMDDAVLKTNGAVSANTDSDANAVEKAWATMKATLATITMGVVTLINILIGVGSKLLLALAMLAYICVYVSGLFVLYIAIAIGPVLMPFQLLRVTSFLFDGWLKFLLGAVMYRVITPIALKLLGGTITSLGSATETLNATGQTAIGYSIASAITIVLLCGLLIVLLWQVPKIATGIVSGSAGVAAKPNIPGFGSFF
ncbi:type IV secretion system protein [Burkholderia glumae]|uniref:type IV secretion system protein n=1 Tax=Burkholderia glumae TaxID=337 RepID=UPI002036EFC1|nr:type IV secretion system protein [Burkholderia glumae]MCM2552662.1 type IV secretion system protein [Burkholderia glumae]